MVCLSVTILSPAKMAEPIKTLFGMWPWVGPRNHVIDGGPDIPTRMGNFEGGTLSAWQDQRFFYNGIRALEKCKTECISVGRN